MMAKLFGNDKKKAAKAPQKPKKPWYREYGEALLVAAILALFIRTFVVQAFKIPSGSMKDTLLIGDHLLVNKFVYGTEIPFTDIQIIPGYRDVQRGDVIVFEFPPDDDKPFFKQRDFIKRVIGLPGDTVAIREQQVYINGEAYRHPQAQFVPGESSLPVAAENRRDNMPPLKVPPGHYFVMGDNRDHSYDSRFWGCVPEDHIKGLAFIKYWSWDREKNWPRWQRMLRPID